MRASSAQSMCIFVTCARRSSPTRPSRATSGLSLESAIARRALMSWGSMRSLTFKLVLAFLLTSVAGMALAAIFIRQSVTSEFDSYVITQQRAVFIDELSAYYERSGTWDGLDRWLREQATRRLAEATPAGTDQRRLALRVRFVLADSAGTVLLPLGRYTLGSTLNQEDMSKGTPITISGRVVGTVITPDRSE